MQAWYMETKTEIKREITMDAAKANIKAMLLIVPVLMVFGIPYIIFWKEQFSLSLISGIASKTILILVFIVIGTLLHEFIHGLFWAFYLKKGFKSIKFGVMWKFLTPYCHSKEPMKMKYYRLGAIMPCIILGIIPATLSLFTGSLAMFGFGVFFTIAAGGDLLMIWLLRAEKRDVLVQDHPDKIGCFILD